MMRRSVLNVVVGAIAVAATGGAAAPQNPSRQVFRANTELVTVNVVVRDRSGALVRDLSRDDFTISEDGATQQISSFDFEQLDAAPELPMNVNQRVLPSTLPTSASTSVPTSAAPAPKIDMHGRRLIVLFFDLSSMQPEELQRAVKAAHAYVDTKLSAADMIAVASFATSLTIDQDFTSSREELAAAIDAYGGANGQGFDNGDAGDSEDTPDNGNAFTADDTEYNLFNTDRRLIALQTLSDALAGIEQKKSVVYFSSGISQSGQDNQVQLRRTVDHANRANVSLYAADMRGLQALVPGGDATQGSRRGRSIFSGDSTRNQVASQAASQDTLTTIAEDTGGRAFFDANSFGQVFDRVVNDTNAYYVLGYSSSNTVRDGRFRRIKVAVRRPGVKLEYRSGYYAGRDAAHLSKTDREQQLQDQLLSDLSATDLSVYVSTAYFRVADNRYFVPISIVVPGYQLPPAASAGRGTLDLLGIVRDEQRRPIGRIRDTVKLAADSGELARKVVQYETGVEMPAGKFHIKVVVRENIGGTFGSYETDVVVPDVNRAPIKLSSVVLGTQLQPSAKKADRNPLVRDGRELVPNVTHVVASGQHLYFFYEIYDPGQTPKLLTSITFFRGKRRVFETPVVEATAVNAPQRKATAFQLDVPAESLPPGIYTCQVNVIDDASGAFTFPRLQLYVKR